MSQQEYSANIPVRMMDLDSDLILVDPQDYRYALNIRNGYGSIRGANTGVKGNSEITYPLPSGENVCIGTAEDPRCKSVIYFVYNSNGQHLILRYYPGTTDANNPEGIIERIAQGPVFNFRKEWKINHAFLVDVRLLYWTDAVTEKQSIEGNPPRKINIEKANVTNRRLRYKLQTERAEDFFSTVPPDLTIAIRDRNVGVTQTWQQSDLMPFQGDPDGFLRFIETQLSTSSFTPWVDVDFCVCELDLYTKNRFNETVGVFISSTGNISGDLVLVPYDHYPVDMNTVTNTVDYLLEEQHISYIKKPPRCEPTADFSRSDDIDSNNVNNIMPQFRTRYWYDDGEKSAWSAISNIPISLDLDGNFLRILNSIIVDFTEDILALPSWRTMITKVELAFRDGNNNQFRSIEILDTCEIGITRNQYSFLNDEVYSIVPSDDFAAQADFQAIKHFDNVPRLTGAMEYVGNREGKGRIFFGANLENYDLDESCIDLTINLDETYEDPCLVTIRGTVNINTFSVTTGFNINESDDASSDFFAFNDGKTFVLNVMLGSNVTRYVADDGLSGPSSWNGGNLDGFVVYLAGTDHYGVSKNYISVPKVERDGSFEIPDVPKGRYVMRVANWLVSTENRYGDIHDLTIGRLWQRTSAPVIDCAGSVAATGIPTERIVDTTNHNSTVFDLDTEPGYGPIVIENMMEVALEETSAIGKRDVKYNIKGYFVDNEANLATPEDRIAAIACERQRINVETLENLSSFPAGFAVKSLITDHNGFWFTTYRAFNDISVPPIPFAQTKIIKNLFPVVPNVCGTGFRNLSQTKGANSIFSGEIYEFGFEGLYNGTEDLVDKNDNNPGISYNPDGLIYVAPTTDGPSADTLILYNSDQDFTDNNKTIVQGRVTESTGIGLTTTLVVIERNGRQERTDVNGNYAISVYCPWDKPRRDDDRILTQYLLDKCARFPPDPLFITLAINDFCSPYNSTTPFVAGGIEYGFAGALTVQDKYLKSGGSYRTGIVYEDFYGRKSTVLEGNTLRIPFHTERGQYGRVFTSWELNGQPPIWATHYRIVRTTDSYYRRYLQLKLGNVEYAIFETVDSTPTITSFANANATHILLQMPNIFDEDTDDQAAIWFFRNENERTFAPEARDRIRFILDQNDELILDDGIIDVEVLGKWVDIDGNYYAIIDIVEVFDTDLREVEEGWLIEIYTPNRADEEIAPFYECGECHLVLDPGTPNRRHSGTIQDQILGTQPARGLLLGGDTYWRIRSFAVDEGEIYRLPVENSNLTDTFQSINQDIGRINIRNDDFGERFYYHLITFSGIFIPEDNVNGLSAVISSDRQFVDVLFGIVKNLVYSGDVLLSINEFKIQPYYIGKDNVLQLSGTQQLGRSDRQTNAANELIQDWGTQHPCSISKNGNYVYGFDARQGLCWRYASNGLTEISGYGAVTFFNEVGKDFEALSTINNDILGIFDREYNCYLLTFPTIEGREGFTISFDENKNGWNQYLSYRPEYYGLVGQNLVSFVDGRLWLHESDRVPISNFYGVQHDNEIDIVVNKYPKSTKMFFNIETQSDRKFWSPEIIIPPNNPYPQGMRSKLLANRWFNYEGHWNADFLRDMNDTALPFRNIADPTLRETTALLKGRLLRGEAMVVKLRLVDRGMNFVLQRVDVGFAISEQSKR